jgi:hypothetical protein
MRIPRSAVLFLASAVIVHAQFKDDFERSITRDPTGVHDWNFFTGDGTAKMNFTAANGFATMAVDATTDRRGIWWALIKREISTAVDLRKAAQPGMELRVEARIRPSDAPKRVNFSFNTSRTTDFHTNLMEFDLSEANVWQTISFTTRDFDVQPGDQLNVQLAMMDWGLSSYHVDIDYLKVDVVDPSLAGPDVGVAVAYRPLVADPASFRHAVAATENATIDRREPDANLADWSAIGTAGPTHVLTVNGTQYVILRWELDRFDGKRIAGSGLLDIKTHSVQRSAERRKDFGMVRVVEILGGDPHWDENSVTYASITQGRKYEQVFNTQMIIDVDVNDVPGGSTLITLSQPVLQRMIDGRTKGIVLIPLGSINAAFLPHTATLRFNPE